MARKKTHEEYVAEVAEKNPNVEVVGKYINDSINITHRCKICNHEWGPSPSYILQGSGRPVCANNHKSIGPFPEYKNSIWASEYKEIAEYYGFSEEQMKTMMPMARTKVKVKCPNCGNIKEIRIAKLFKSGLRCNKCSDGFSYPEKFMAAFLNQLNINYKPQYSPNWAENKRYDFYLPDYNCIIETHGAQHYEENTRGRSLKKEQENDLLKEKLAKQNNIKNYIVIDCRESNLKWIKIHIIESNLRKILKFKEDEINWSKCGIYAIQSRIQEAADLWNNQNISTSEIASIMNIGETTILRWMKQAAECGLCDYTVEKGKKRGYIKNSGDGSYNAKPINQYDLKGNFIKMWNYMKEASYELNINLSCICACCRGNQKTAGGFIWRYADEAEQENLKGEE